MNPCLRVNMIPTFIFKREEPTHTHTHTYTSLITTTSIVYSYLSINGTNPMRAKKSEGEKQLI